MRFSASCSGSTRRDSRSRRSWNPGALTAGAVLALAACGGDQAPTAETPRYEEWAQRRREIPSAGFAETVSGTIEILGPGDRAGRPDDFCELWVNGKKLHRLRVAPLPDGTSPSVTLKVQLRVGPNWLDFWDSTTDHGRREPVDTREGTTFAFTPSDDGYEFTQTKDE